MAKLFGLFIFINFFLVGIAIGNSRQPLTVKLVSRVLAYFFAVYVLMGLYLTTNTDFLIPQ